ncbi:hypothetical protein [Limimaricola litoreus]|uniref:Glycosyl transferases group 1 n=1 Tax=Limimaricola litoreus TaxID=2955316 RepID=A0A9X2FRU0_9RHOB|nr:hypothetical protein [Limimaricola litoreus]MCP1170057.1 hypothetical protein [Limimaricola litoreus]
MRQGTFPPAEEVHTPRPALILGDDGSRGWGPIEHFARLAARLLDLDLQRPPLQGASRLAAVRQTLMRPRKGPAPGAIYLAKSPGDVKSLMALERFDRPRRFRALWIVDSFWTEWAPSPRLMRHFDMVIYMQKGEARFYEDLAPGRSLHLGWGSDVLDLGSNAAARPVDVLRVGRQPPEWEEDANSRAVCDAAGLRFAGRPPFLADDPADPSSGHRDLCARYAQAKFVMAHSNLAAPASYTHPHKEYLTGRWTDAIAAGAVVAGVQPFGDASAEDLLWPGATLDFDRIDLSRNVAALRGAVAAWSPTVARQNYRQALGRLDWRWRIKALADRLDLGNPALTSELARLEQAISVAPTE